MQTINTGSHSSLRMPSAQQYAGRHWTPFSATPRLPGVQCAAEQSQAGSGKKVVGLGSCGIDYLAAVAAFPKPDEKLRTENLELQGGGNCANALTGAARLGLRPALITKIGDDSFSDAIVEELRSDGVDTSHVLRAEGFPSPFTYIIVDKQGGTRTCIHTPSAPLQPEDITFPLLEAALEGAALVFFHGRLTEAAIVVADAARARGIPILVEAERVRDNLPHLLRRADFVTSSANYAKNAMGEEDIGSALVSLLASLPHAKWLMSTQGKRGSIALERGDSGSGALGQEPAAALDEVLPRLWQDIDGRQADAPGCTTSAGVQIGAGAVAEQQGSFRTGVGEAAIQGRVVVASSAALPEGSVVDTTGAGDAFNAAVIYGIVKGLPPEQIMQLGAVVAAAKCTAIGARPGLPESSRIVAALL